MAAGAPEFAWATIAGNEYDYGALMIRLGFGGYHD